MLAVGLVIVAEAAGCTNAANRPQVTTSQVAESHVTTSQAATLTDGQSLCVAGTLTKVSSDQWCIHGTVATICAPPSPHLQSEKMPPRFRNGATVRAKLSDGPPDTTWSAVLMHVG
jgi:hypothetical protein